MASDPIAEGKSNVQGAYGQGQNAINAFDPTAWGQNTQSGFSTLFGNQQGQQNDYIQSYKNAILSNPSATQLYNTGNTLFNVPQLKQNATTLNNLELTTPQTTLDSARGFNYDQNQVNNQTALTLGRIAPLASAANNSAQNAESLAQGYVGAGMAQNQMNLLPVQQQGSMLNDLWARQASGFTTAAEGTLNGLIQRMNAGERLSESEMQQYAQLATAEENYNAQIESAKIGAQATLGAANIKNQFQTIPAGQSLVNTFKNTIINPSMLSAPTGMASYG